MKKKTRENTAQSGHQRHAVHRHSAGFAGDLHDDITDNFGRCERRHPATAPSRSATRAREGYRPEPGSKWCNPNQSDRSGSFAAHHAASRDLQKPQRSNGLHSSCRGITFQRCRATSRRCKGRRCGTTRTHDRADSPTVTKRPPFPAAFSFELEAGLRTGTGADPGKCARRPSW